MVLVGDEELAGHRLRPTVDPDLPVNVFLDEGEPATAAAIDLGVTCYESVLDCAAHAFVRIAVEKICEGRREIQLFDHPVQHVVERGRSSVGAIENRAGIVNGNGFAIVPKSSVAEVSAPFNVESIRTLQRDVLDRGELQFLARG